MNCPPTALAAQQAIRLVLQHVGEDPDRDGLTDTPERVVKALAELTSGYTLDPAVVLATTFDVEYDQMVMSRAIPFVSLCEHHMLPFVGTATIGYLPGKRVVGLSKLARLVDLYARRLQIQERLTQQIACAIDTHLTPQGVGVVIRARHSCQAARGIRKDGEMITSAMLGEFREGTLRAEFLALA
jgi:GTP cyclohydrolase IA